ncbi:hypothetical protein TRICHSKD4_1197 [Roseibium sp. TrichSKD4]|nr:hypothetical protein [Roseibium sp. TrichSKD4]EFO33428.1 hypothetical protein TRICHSKD4_1197 [Roseibium sp. TrichSKD4]
MNRLGADILNAMKMAIRSATFAPVTTRARTTATTKHFTKTTKTTA